MFARRQDRIEAQIWAGRDSSLRVSGTVTDISLGGCYAEMLAPLPVDTDLEIVLTPEDTSLRVRGTVRSSHAGLGMGIAFTSMSPASFETPPICSTGRTLCQ
jgi:hypothetical protein